ncbi:Abi family protein [Azonexus fungiphilus]|uniref:Abi family protein n=1 Tax=Azonexus fungiphilus TaxID=146940 RepID=UPI00156BCBAB|nr:Abi family protein [Azonexus fungiphilus]NHC06879.1 hypothetical protein [Azonexus fungiphilus]
MFSPSELQALQHITSAARLSSYKHCLGTTTPAETYGAYMWSMAVSTAFTPLIQALEVSLRNAINNALSPAYGANWFEVWATNSANELRAGGKLQGKSEGENLIAKARSKLVEKAKKEKQRTGTGPLPVNYHPSWQAILAEMTFGFWVTFLNKRFWDINQRSKLWPNYLTTVFPNAPTPLYAQGALHKEFNEVLDIRNRIHHQEPLWKHHSVACHQQAINYLRQQLSACCLRLAYMSPVALAALERYGAIAAIDELCSESTFQRFIGHSCGQTKPLRTARKDLRLLARNTPINQSIWLVSPTEQPLLVVRHASRRYF